MMKSMVLFGLLAIAFAAPMDEHAKRTLPALEHEEVHDEFGQFALRYVTSEGTVVSERGRLVPSPDKSGYVMVLEGQTSFIGDDGKIYVTKYTAGLDGYKAEGNHLPVAPAPIEVAPIAPAPAAAN